MKVRSDSWHWWMVKTFTDCDSQYDFDNLKNACAYRGKVVKSFLGLFITLALGLAVAIFLSSPVWVPILEFFFPTPEGEGSPWPIAIIATLCWIAIGCIVMQHKGYWRAGWNWVKSKLALVVPEKVRAKLAEEKPPREPTFLEQWFSDVWNKICPTDLELVHPDEKDGD